jgi:hypothetical protein
VVYDNRQDKKENLQIVDKIDYIFKPGGYGE